MKIQVPLVSINEIKSLIEAGANEFYCGLVPGSWIKEYGFEVSINCRSTYPNANFYEIGELREAIKIAHSYGTEVFLTFNESSYNQRQIDYIIELINKLINIKIDGVIVSAMSLLVEIYNRNVPVKVIISGEANCTNSYAVEFYKDMGAKRIVFPRHMSIKEINSITAKHLDIEFEAFCLNEGCFFNGGHCYSIHYNMYSQMCKTLRYELKPNSNVYSEEEYKQICKDNLIKRVGRIPNTSFLNTKLTKCGLCSVKLLGACGVEYLKVVGRTGSIDSKIKWTKIVKKAIDLSKETDSFEEFGEICKNTIWGGEQANYCGKKKFCYYPNEISLLDIL